MPVVVMFKKQQGKPKQDVLAIRADIEAKNLDAVFMATNNLTYTAGKSLCTQHKTPYALIPWDYGILLPGGRRSGRNFRCLRRYTSVLRCCTELACCRLPVI